MLGFLLHLLCIDHEDTCICKAYDWANEKEWRLVLLQGPEAPAREWKMPKPSKLFLGACISESHAEKINALAKKRGIPVFQMVLAQDSYKMIEGS
ncbi:MAG: hypothetical protein AB7F43_11675 [Bacteriovoracia bacterium]